MNIKENVSLAPYTVFKIGGPARWFCEVKNKEELAEALGWAGKNHAQFFVLGAGSNVLASEDGFPGLVIRMNIQDLQIAGGNRLVAGSGVSMAKAVNFAIENGLAGFEWAVGIPGTIGGSVFGNAGCYGSETKDVVESVEVLEITTPLEANIFPDLAQFRHLGTSREIRQQANIRVWENVAPRKGWPSSQFTNKKCQFSYRNSLFKKHPEWIILGATLRLPKGDEAKSREKILEYIKKRALTQDVGEKCAGCIFKNPDPAIAAAYLIDKAGLKNKSVGSAVVSPKHANYIVNRGGATAQDVRGLIELIKTEVKKAHGVTLEEEIRVI